MCGTGVIPNLCNISFKGQLISINQGIKAVSNLSDVDSFETASSKIDWLEWMSKRVSFLYNQKKKQPNKVNELFDYVKTSFDDKNNRLFLDDLFTSSPEDANNYKKSLNKVLLQFQHAGVSSKKCNEIKEGLDFIEGVSSYKNIPDLYDQKFNP